MRRHRRAMLMAAMVALALGRLLMADGKAILNGHLGMLVQQPISMAPQAINGAAVIGGVADGKANGSDSLRVTGTMVTILGNPAGQVISGTAAKVLNGKSGLRATSLRLKQARDVLRYSRPLLLKSALQILRKMLRNLVKQSVASNSRRHRRPGKITFPSTMAKHPCGSTRDE